MPPRPNGPRLSMKESMKQLDKKTLFRLLSYMKPYRLHLVFVFICIAVSAFASVMSSLFLKSLIDDYISPLLLESNPNFSGLLYALLQMAVIYVIGAFSTLFYNRAMAVVSQGTLKKIRDEMFEHMQTLPIKFFDTHTHGDIMSFYTNDTDTLRQMISQSIPQTLSSIFTVVSVFCSMLTLSIWLTLFLIAFLFVMFKIVGKVTAKSGSYFVRQQQSLGNVNGYIEEMINGQKVIKVFCHEDKTKVEFDKRNDDLFTNASEANKFANILGPIMNALGYFLYVLIAVLGGGLALAGVPNLTLTGMGVMTLGRHRIILTALPQLRYADQSGHAADLVHHHGYGRRFPASSLCSMPRAKRTRATSRSSTPKRKTACSPKPTSTPAFGHGSIRIRTARSPIRSSPVT